MKKQTFFIAATLCFAISMQAQITVLHSFNDTTGSNPTGNLILLGSKLYGMTPWGGANDSGCIFSIDTNGTGYKDLFDFGGTPDKGYSPNGSLIISGNVFYALAITGGAYNQGCIFSIDTNGTEYKDLYDFNYYNGAFPTGDLTLSGSILYGMTRSGGVHGSGNIFSIDTNGTGYNDLWDFNVTNGEQPDGSLTLSGNRLFGMTNVGGAINNFGVIFSINTNGTGYKDLWNFDDTAGTNGEEPNGSLTLSGNMLYGMTYRGGLYDEGIVFSIDTNGTEYNDLWDFGSNGTDGLYPEGDLTLSGNMLYGMTWQGGTNYEGTIFSVDTNGTGYKQLWDFGGIGSNGAYPENSLTLSGNILYGMTETGGTDGYGIIFKLDTNSITSISRLETTGGVMNLYPNPNTGEFTVSLLKPSEKADIIIYNLIGEKVYEGALNPNVTQINISNQPAGLYLYRIIAEDGQLISSGKVIIQ